ncbi:broad-complex core protein isoforms 1/2/3/4/5-like isoform X2 [Leptopilina boulardi]|uniref:broad-complex core protein isoforms 1/2/3/4/5-like isoform X2 n=1 Tax=Leptopilina boulardi TaxID=63433 RepID=UPI0021F59C0F|nr:broad-complex core protein isoforms 1/2/3/4/5-like isoform X2 [Leptopilina boulardi]
MGSSQQFSLRWNNYLKHITCAFDTLRTDEDLVDVTLSCEGKRIRAHKMLLSACSTYFRDLFKENPCQHPVVIFRNVKFDDLAALVDFMYQGEVNVVQEQLASFLTTAELLAVQGLTDGSGKDNDSLVEDDIEIPNEPEVQLQNASGRITTNNKGSKSPASPVELQSEPPPTKKRKCRENSNIDKGTKNSEKADSQKGVSEPVEIIPLMPNLKLEMPEYLEQDGSSCSYDDQSAGDSNKLGIDDNPSDNQDNDQKPDISQTFYSNQSTSDSLDGKQAELGHLLSKPSTSGERLAQESAQEKAEDDANIDIGLSNDDDFGQTSNAELLFRCRICWKGFKHPMSLTLHKNLHNGQTICPICQRVFSRSYDMKIHLQRIHKYTISVNAKFNFRK